MESGLDYPSIFRLHFHISSVTIVDAALIIIQTVIVIVTKWDILHSNGCNTYPFSDQKLEQDQAPNKKR